MRSRSLPTINSGTVGRLTSWPGALGSAPRTPDVATFRAVNDFPVRLPTSRIGDPIDAPPLRWGVIAPGRIAGSFVDALARCTRQRLVAVGSRSAARAQAFAATHGADKAYPSYEQLVCDPEVDIVYV